MNTTRSASACSLFYHAARTHGVEAIRKPLERLMRHAVSRFADPDDDEGRKRAETFTDNVLGYLDGKLSFQELAYTPGVADIYTSDPKCVLVLSLLNMFCGNLGHSLENNGTNVYSDPLEAKRDDFGDAVDEALVPLAEELLEALK